MPLEGFVAMAISIAFGGVLLWALWTGRLYKWTDKLLGIESQEDFEKTITAIATIVDGLHDMERKYKISQRLEQVEDEAEYQRRLKELGVRKNTDTGEFELEEEKKEEEPKELDLPVSRRMEHQQVIAGTGHGKTTLLKEMIAKDIRKDATIIVMDSQGDLINDILGLDIHQDRIIHIDPTDVEYPLALNLFDVGMEKIEKLSAFEQERHVNSIIALYDFVLGSLLGAELTQKQDVAFRFVMRLMLVIPNSTIHTLRELFTDAGFANYADYVERLSPTAQAFFREEFNSREFSATKQQVVRRIYGILENSTLERMFSNPKSKINIGKEVNSGKLILINTSKDLLKADGSQLFGRFFIALIAQAVQERASLQPNQRKETYFYIDEAQEYFDSSMVEILEQARKYRCGMIFAHQNLDQLGDFKRAVSANTSIKCAGGLSMSDARVLAPDMHVEPEQLTQISKLSFMVSVRGQRTTIHKFDPKVFDGLPKRLDTQGLKIAMRERYAVDSVADVVDSYEPPKEMHTKPVTEVKTTDEL